MLSDFNYAFRTLARAPGFTLASILILAIAIGANTAVFSVVEAVLIRPLPFARQAELYSISSSAADQFALFALPEFCDYRDGDTGFQGLAAVGTFNTTLVDQGEAQIVQGVRISANAFELLGASPAAGRLLVPDDDLPNAAPVVLISYGVWQANYAGRPDAIGRKVSLSGHDYTIVGVLPPGFVLPLNGFNRDVCIPLQPDSDPARYNRGSLHFLRVIGRVAPGVGPAQAQAKLDATLRTLRSRYPDEYRGDGRNAILPLADQIVGEARPQLLTLLGAVGALLLLACANLAGLHSVRVIGRRRELAIRTALGSSRFGLLRPLLAECLLLAAAGGVAGLMVANLAVQALTSLIPAGLPRAHEVRFDGGLFVFAAAVSMVAGFAPALIPAGLFTRTDVRGAVGPGGRAATAGPSQSRLRYLLVSAQIAVALALLAGTALFLRSFWAVEAVRVGFDTGRVLSARISLPETQYRDPDALIRFDEKLRASLGSIPGVKAVGATSLLPLTTGLATVEFSIVGRPQEPEGSRPSADYRIVTPGYFAAMGIPLVQGRLPAEQDDREHPLAVIVNAALAARFFPDQPVIGQRLSVDDTAAGNRTAEIVGVVGDVREGAIESQPAFEIYVGYRQMDPVAVPWIRYRTFWVLRTVAPPQTVAGILRQRIRALDPGVAVASVQTMGAVVDLARSARRFTLIVIGFFAAAAVLLTAAGIYSVIAYGVTQRTRELGIRLALGATGGEMQRLVFREGFGVLTAGSALGVVAALGLSQLIASQLYGVGPGDPRALAASVLLLVAVALLACWLPARRAARVDPIVALRTE